MKKQISITSYLTMSPQQEYLISLMDNFENPRHDSGWMSCNIQLIECYTHLNTYKLFDNAISKIFELSSIRSAFNRRFILTENGIKQMPTPHNSYKLFIEENDKSCELTKAENDLFNPDKDGTLLILKYSKKSNVLYLYLHHLIGDAVTAGVVLTLLNDFFTETQSYLLDPKRYFQAKFLKSELSKLPLKNDVIDKGYTPKETQLLPYQDVENFFNQYLVHETKNRIINATDIYTAVKTLFQNSRYNQKGQKAYDLIISALVKTLLDTKQDTTNQKFIIRVPKSGRSIKQNKKYRFDYSPGYKAASEHLVIVTSKTNTVSDILKSIRDFRNNSKFKHLLGYSPSDFHRNDEAFMVLNIRTESITTPSLGIFSDTSGPWTTKKDSSGVHYRPKAAIELGNDKMTIHFTDFGTNEDINIFTNSFKETLNNTLLEISKSTAPIRSNQKRRLCLTLGLIGLVASNFRRDSYLLPSLILGSIGIGIKQLADTILKERQLNEILNRLKFTS